MTSGFLIRPSPGCASKVAVHLAGSGESQKQEEEVDWNKVLAMQTWPNVKQTLNNLPVFCCANAKGQALQYSIVDINKPGDQTMLPFFFCDVEAAKEELLKAQQETQLEGLALVPYFRDDAGGIK